MANLNNVKIELYNGERLDYESPQSLGIKFNRIVDDFTNPSKRSGEFSYSINLPKTKKNDDIFEYADVKGRTKIFVGKSFPCRVFNNEVLLLDGIIELVGIDSDSYRCNFYSNVTQLIDDIGNKSLTDLDFVSAIPYPDSYSFIDIEKFIIQHIEAGYANSDETSFQFPLIYYSNFYLPGIIADPNLLNFRYVFDIYNSSSDQFDNSNPQKNWIYYHQLPPAFYLVSIVNSIFENSGWSIGGSWINREEVKKIIVPYVNDNPPEYSIDFINNTINLTKTLPKIKQIDLLKNIISLFDLYIFINPQTKEVVLEDFVTLFSNNTNPYNINNKIDIDTINKKYDFDFNVKAQFDDSDNNKFAGCKNQSIYVNNNNDLDCISFTIIPYAPFDATFSYPNTIPPYIDNSYIGKDDGTKSLSISFEVGNLLSTYLYNVYSKNGTLNPSSETYNLPISIPMISTQNFTGPSDEIQVNSPTGSTFVDNSPSEMEYSGTLQLLYYYGTDMFNGNASTYSGFTDNWTGNFNDYAYINVATGGTTTIPTGKAISIPFASPYQLIRNSDRDRIVQLIQEYYDGGQGYLSTYRGMEIQNLLRTYYMGGNTNDIYETTPYSLVMGNGEDLLFDTLYTKFHRPKYQELQNGHLLTAIMRMDENDWREMQINRTIIYNDELYRLVAIKGYDPINRTANIELAKKT